MTLAHRRVRVGPGGTAGDGLNTNVKQVNLSPGALRFVGVDYVSTGNAEQDLVIKRDSSAGATIFTKANNETDIIPTAVGTAGMDEGQAVIAATDGVCGGLAFSEGLYFSIAQMDNASYADVDIWYDSLVKKAVTLKTDTNGDATARIATGFPGVIRFIQVDYSATAGAGTTLTLADDTRTLFTKDANEVDFGPTAVGAPAMDEAGAATAATDALSGGLPFKGTLTFTVASGGSTKTNFAYLWMDASR